MWQTASRALTPAAAPDTRGADRSRREYVRSRRPSLSRSRGTCSDHSATTSGSRDSTAQCETPRPCVRSSVLEHPDPGASPHGIGLDKDLVHQAVDEKQAPAVREQWIRH